MPGVLDSRIEVVQVFETCARLHPNFVASVACSQSIQRHAHPEDRDVGGQDAVNINLMTFKSS